MARKTTRRKAKQAARRRAAAPTASPSSSASSSPPSPQGTNPGRALPLFALLVLTAAAYWPAYFAGFVWDDKAFLEAPPVSAALGGLMDIWFNPASLPFEAHYWPMLYSSFWLDHKLMGGFNPAGFHAVNVLLHGANTVLLWRLLARMNVPGAWAIAAVFALHPARVEAVAWIIARKDLLATLFYLLGFHCWLRLRERPTRSAYAALLVLFAAGMLAKSLIITMPAALLVWVWWRRDQVGLRDVMQVAPLFLLGGAIAAGDLSFYGSRADIDFDFSLAERLIIASKALWFYPAQLLWPHPLPVIYPLWDIDPAKILNWLYLPAACAFAAMLWMARRHIGRGPLAAALFYAVTVSPTLGFGDNSYMEYSFVADRYQYLSGIGLLMLLLSPLAIAARRFAVNINAARFCLALLLTVCATLTWRHAHVYRDEIALFGHVVSLNPLAHSAHYNLGIALMEAGRLREAEAAYKAEVRRDATDPKYLQAVNHLASLHFNDGRYGKAAQLYRYSASANPADAETHQNLGSALAQSGRLREAVKSFKQALELDPGLEMAQDNLRLAIEKINAQSGAAAPPR